MGQFPVKSFISDFKWLLQGIELQTWKIRGYYIPVVVQNMFDLIKYFLHMIATIDVILAFSSLCMY